MYITIGPAFWGLINPEWSLCNKGRRQSPINFEPQRLLFDPNLRPLHIDKHRVSILYLIALNNYFIFNDVNNKQFYVGNWSYGKYWAQCHISNRFKQ